jgi:hypothetical protein
MHRTSLAPAVRDSRATFSWYLNPGSSLSGQMVTRFSLIGDQVPSGHSMWLDGMAIHGSRSAIRFPYLGTVLSGDFDPPAVSPARACVLGGVPPGAGEHETPHACRCRRRSAFPRLRGRRGRQRNKQRSSPSMGIDPQQGTYRIGRRSRAPQRGLHIVACEYPWEQQRRPASVRNVPKPFRTTFLQNRSSCASRRSKIRLPT